MMTGRGGKYEWLSAPSPSSLSSILRGSHSHNMYPHGHPNPNGANNKFHIHRCTPTHKVNIYAPDGSSRYAH
eukprot:9189910-Karenia_brevis.AAC.1